MCCTAPRSAAIGDGPISGLVTLEPPRPNSIPGLNSCFRRLAGAAPDSKLLPLEETP